MSRTRGRPVFTIGVILTAVGILLGPVRADPASLQTTTFAQLNELTQRMASTSADLAKLTSEADLLGSEMSEPETKLAQAAAFVTDTERRVAAAASLLRLRQKQMDVADGVRDGQATLHAITGPAFVGTNVAALDEQLSAIDKASRRNQQMATQIRRWQGELEIVRARLEAYGTALRSAGFQIAIRREALRNSLATIRRLAEQLRRDREAADVLVSRLPTGAHPPAERVPDPASWSAARDANVHSIRTLERKEGDLDLKQVRVAQMQSRLWSMWGRVVKEQAVLRKGMASTQRREIDDLNQDKAIAEALAAARSAGLLTWRATSGVLLLCPVDPPRAYWDDFGAPRWGGGFHLHQGNDIFAALGTPIRAPFPGLAVDATNDLGGLAVKVLGAKGYVYNAHLSAFGTLGTVTTGAIIGYVGNTGDARGGPTHDHFEWHPDNGAAVNPFPYLNSVC